MIELSKNWRIDNSKPPEMILQHNKKITVTKKLVPTGEIRYEWINEAYCSSLKSVFTSFLNRYASRGNSIAEVLSRVEEVHVMFKDNLTLYNTMKTEAPDRKEEVIRLYNLNNISTKLATTKEKEIIKKG